MEALTQARSTGLRGLCALCLLAVAVLSVASALSAQTPQQALSETIATLESDLQARIGIQILDTADGWTWGHRQDERFLMASTFKSVLCGAVLQATDQGRLSLTEPLTIRADQIHGHAPVTEGHVGSQLPVADLCLATLDLSDNGAANLLIDRLGGPAQVTVFLRGIGDPVTRLDRKEPDLNLFAPGDPRDTTSPAAMVATWQALLLGDALSPASRSMLTDWMSHGGVTGDFFRASAAAGWRIADKSGGGRDQPHPRHCRASGPTRPRPLCRGDLSVGHTRQLVHAKQGRRRPVARRGRTAENPLTSHRVRG